jgi:hypothetical protein
VKYRRADATSTAALISEVVSHALLQRLGIRTLEAVLVSVHPGFARACVVQGLTDYEIEAGLHFGTVFRPDVQPAAPETWTWEQLARPSNLITIWVADSWLMNLDRAVYGNILLEQAAVGAWNLIAADQTDCFLGAGALADGSCFGRSRSHGAAPYLPLLEYAFVTLGVTALQEALLRVRETVPYLPDATARVPLEWWRQAGVSSETVIACLSERASRIDQIVELAKWEGLSRATEGGRELGL